MGCSSSTGGFQNVSCARKSKQVQFKVWDDNRALHEAEMQELSKEQLEAFNQHWDEVLRFTMAMSAEQQSKFDRMVHRRREDPDAAEAWKTRLKSLFDENKFAGSDKLSKLECLAFLEEKVA